MARILWEYPTGKERLKTVAVLRFYFSSHDLFMVRCGQSKADSLNLKTAESLAGGELFAVIQGETYTDIINTLKVNERTRQILGRSADQLLVLLPIEDVASAEAYVRTRLRCSGFLQAVNGYHIAHDLRDTHDEPVPYIVIY
jgi:hypothetical protein